MCKCWQLCEVIAWSCMFSLNWKFLMWGRRSWIILYAEKTLCWYKNKNMYSLMSLWCSDMYFGRGIIGTCTDGFMWRFMIPCINGLAGPYMWSALTDSLVVSGQLLIINSCRYVLNLDVPSQYKCCYDCWTFLAPSTPSASKNQSFFSLWIENSRG